MSLTTRFSGIRLDRALSLAVFRPLGRIGTRPGIPILMYHSVCDASEAKHPYFATNISPTSLEGHLEFLRDQGYAAVHLSEVIEMLRIGGNSRKLVAITFDDGFRNFYTQAFPQLRKYGYTATLFVPSGLVGKESSSLGPEPFMTWQEIREVSRHGIEIGSHSVRHANLYRADSRTIDDEVRFSKAVIEDNISQPVHSFAYPYAFPEHDKEFSRNFAGLLEQTGYDNGVSTVIGRARLCHSRFVLPRLPVNSHDDLALFAAKLNGYYDWLHLPQYVHKASKAVLLPSIRPTEASQEGLRAPWIFRS
jgi:peptidoglycan/xylan/chitin deacetylase (PgdA/CDA1 family)